MIRRIGVALFFISISALSPAGEIQTNLTLVKVGAQGSNGYFTVEEPLIEACLYDTIYVTITSDYGRAAYALLLSAKTSDTMIARISYTYNETTAICTLDLIEII